MAYTYLRYAEEGMIGTLTLSAPESLNSLNSKLISELKHFLLHLNTKAVRVLVLTGDGDRSFVAGADISEMAGFDEVEGFNFGHAGAEVFCLLEDLPIPTIAAINGFCLGGGCEIAMACDIRYASSKAKFGQPEVGLGIIPGFSGTYRLPKLIGQGMAKELIYSGKVIKADEALRIGLINGVTAPEELMTTVRALAEKIAKNAPVAVRNAKQCINRNYDMNRTDALRLENNLFAQCFDTEDQKNGMTAFLNKENVEYKGE
ncbi:MAG: enoyl-CoA hydratase/isomerase family protein [Paludibacteraceae bacterium]|nr:enoyl-CoA hydratase/isomerase family protein [Paludibacteraceae bacterium]